MSKTETIGCSPKTLWLGLTRSFLPGVIEALAPAIVAFALAIAVLSGLVFACALMGATDWPGYSSQAWSGLLFARAACQRPAGARSPTDPANG